MTWGLMLNPQGIAVPDQPAELYRHGLPSNATTARAIVPFVETLMSDDEAWDALFDDAFRLSVFRTVYGNRPSARYLERRRAAAAAAQPEQLHLLGAA